MRYSSLIHYIRYSYAKITVNLNSPISKPIGDRRHSILLLTKIELSVDWRASCYYFFDGGKEIDDDVA